MKAIEEKILVEFDEERRKIRKEVKLQTEKTQQTYKENFGNKKKYELSYEFVDFIHCHFKKNILLRRRLLKMKMTEGAQENEVSDVNYSTGSGLTSLLKNNTYMTLLKLKIIGKYV